MVDGSVLIHVDQNNFIKCGKQNITKIIILITKRTNNTEILHFFCWSLIYRCSMTKDCWGHTPTRAKIEHFLWDYKYNDCKSALNLSWCWPEMDNLDLTVPSTPGRASWTLDPGIWIRLVKQMLISDLVCSFSCVKVTKVSMWYFNGESF